MQEINMPTPRKSIEQLKLTGTYQMNKARYEHRLNPVPTIQLPVGRPPAHLPALERAVWAEVVRSVPEGLLGRPDRLVLEVATRLIIKMRTGAAKPSEVGALLNVLAKLGMTPAARLKMNLQPLDIPTESNAEKNAWDELDELD
jgi:phage terminase small subunit